MGDSIRLQDVEVISSGFFGIDVALGVGGISTW